jgi:hypothetical protein
MQLVMLTAFDFEIEIEFPLMKCEKQTIIPSFKVKIIIKSVYSSIQEVDGTCS